MKNRSALIITGAAYAIIGIHCGSEVGRIPFSDTGQGSAQIILDNGHRSDNCCPGDSMAHKKSTYHGLEVHA